MADDTEEPWANDPIAESPEVTVGQVNAESAPWENDPIVGGQEQPVDSGSSSNRLNARYNNPGALGPTQSALKYGGTPSGHFDTGHPFMAFPTPEAGAAAQFSMWQNPKLYRDHTLADAITNWIGPGEHGEAEYIASRIGLPLHTVITDDLLRGPMGIKLMQAQAHYEGANVLTKEQWQRGQDWAYKGAKPGGNGQQPWDNDPIVQAGDDLTHGDAAAPWIKDPIVKASDQSPTQPEYAGTDKPQPASKPQEANPWDVGKFLQTFVGSGVQQLLGSEKGQAESQLHPETRQVLPYEEQVQQAKEDAILKNPNTSQEEADDIIHQRNQRLSYVKANAQQNVQETTAALKEAGSRVDQRYEATGPGQVAKTLGAGGASLIPGLTGPAAPLTLATQMGGEAYSEEKDRAVTAAKKAHPEWSDDQIEAASTQAAENAARTSAESGIVLSLLPVPKLGGLLARVVERVGMRGAYMVVAGAAQDISANKELQNIDPKQALYEGVLARMPANFVAGGAFELPGAIGEAVTGRPNAAPEAPQETPETQPEAKAPEAQQTPQAPEKVVAAAVRYGDQIGTGNIHAQAIEDLASKGVRGENPDDFYQNSENGYVTDTGRFITREEADQMTGRGKDSLSVVQPEAEPEQTPEDTDKWVSAIANRYSQERSAAGEIGEIAPGEGYSRTDLREVGLKMSPEEINQHVSDLMHDTGNPKLQAAAVSAEEARLSQRSSQLSRKAEDNPGDQQAKIDADNAFKDLTDFHNGPVAKLKNNWHAQGMTLQGEVPVDLSTFNGLREAWLRDVGTRINPSLEMTMRNTAKRVRNAVSAEDMAMQRLGQEIEKPARKSLPSDEQVRNNIMARMKNEPCRV